METFDNGAGGLIVGETIGIVTEYTNLSGNHVVDPSGCRYPVGEIDDVEARAETRTKYLATLYKDVRSYVVAYDAKGEPVAQ